MCIRDRSEGTSFGGSRSGVQITVKRVDIAARKSNGEAWDLFGGKPDPRVYIKRKVFLGGKGHSKTVQNNFTFNTNETILGGKKGDTLEIEVFDMDELKNDLIGRTELELDASTIRRGRVVLSFGQVDELVLAVEN